MSEFVRKVKFAAAYDKRNVDGQNYGVHGVHIYFSVVKDGEGITFSVSTNWQLPHVQAETDAARQPPSNAWLFYKPQAFGVDYHRKTKQEYACYRKECDITGGECWSDGSGLLGDEFLQALIEGGDEALFARMEAQYEAWCGK